MDKMRGVLRKKDDGKIYLAYDIRESFHRSIEVHPDQHIPEFGDELPVEFSIQSFDDGSLSLTGRQGTKDYAIIHKTDILGEMKRISPIPVHRLSHEEEPIAVYAFKSGWDGFYHVIVEWGAYEQFDHKFMTAFELINTYPQFNTIDKEPIDIAISGREAISTNSMELAQNLRKRSMKIEEKHEQYKILHQQANGLNDGH
jgi:hypothetical protein